VAATGAVIIPRIEPVALTPGTLALAAVVAALTATAAVLGMRASPRLGGRAISTLALGTSLVLGLAPVLLLVAIALSGGI